VTPGLKMTKSGPEPKFRPEWLALEIMASSIHLLVHLGWFVWIGEFVMFSCTHYDKNTISHLLHVQFDSFDKEGLFSLILWDSGWSLGWMGKCQYWCEEIFLVSLVRMAVGKAKVMVGSETGWCLWVLGGGCRSLERLFGNKVGEMFDFQLKNWRDVLGFDRWRWLLIGPVWSWSRIKDTFLHIYSHSLLGGWVVPP
jgi:hypothetical protein